MAAIAQSDPYNCLIRKIGYSAGLERLVERVTALAKMYVRDGRLTPSSWRQLVKETFGRHVDVDVHRSKTKSAADHIADFYSSLSILLPIRAEIHPQWALDVLAIILRYDKLSSNDMENAIKGFLLLRIIETDGDIFLNALDAGFEDALVTRRLEQMIIRKREAILRVIKNPHVLRKIFGIVDIRDLPSKDAIKGARDARIPQSAFLHSPPVADDVSVNEKYLKKMLPTRKGWAKDFGLYHDHDGITDAGRAVLGEFRRILNCGELNEPILVWPIETELAKLRLTPTVMQVPLLTSWDFLSAVGRSYGGITILDYVESERGALVALFERLFQLYKGTNSDRAVLKNQLPKYVASPAAVMTYGLPQRAISNLDEFIRDEVNRIDRRFEFVNIRGTEGGLAFKGK
jgi:hypothetical protein